MPARVQRWGNSLAVRIPKSFAVEAHLDQNTSVKLSLRGGELVIAAVKPTSTLDELLARITEQNIHDEQDIGPSLGNEKWV